jgi:large subunit ribosomal protein L23
MDLTVYDVIRGPVISDKAYKLNKNLKKLVLNVHPDANKGLVADALRKLFNVEVASVAILIRKGKTKRIRKTNQKTVGTREKRAVVTLAEGHTLDLFDQKTQAQAPVQEQAAKKA